MKNGTPSTSPSGGCLSSGENKEELPRYHQRAISHNYSAPFIYHIIIKKKQDFEALFRYIRENPHRLAMRRQFPQFFQRVRKLTIFNQEYEAYGNLFLFRNPDKDAVIIRSAFTPEEVAEKTQHWLADASRGTVLVSPFINKVEKSIRSEAEDMGAKVILITHEAFGERFKPAAHDFNLCSQGHLLIISLGMPLNTPISRKVCVEMNKLATTISE